MLKKDIKVYFKQIKVKEQDDYKSVPKHSLQSWHTLNYIPLTVLEVSVYSLNNKQNICDAVFAVLGEGYWLLAGWHKARTKFGVVQHTLLKVKLKAIGDSRHSIESFELEGLSHYWFWRKTEEQITLALEAGTSKVLWQKYRR